MNDFSQESKERLRRTMKQEMMRMEDDFDTTRDYRAELTAKLVSAARTVEIVDATSGRVVETTDDGIKVINAALKALADTEKASSQAIALKLKQSELEQNTIANSKDRIEIVLRATAPGQIKEAISTESLGDHLSDLFDGQIKSGEMKSNPRDLEDG